MAAPHIDGYDGLDLVKPHRPGNQRRPLRDFELVELAHETASGGDDPELDALLFDYGIATGSRRLGAYSLTCGQLHDHSQLIGMKDKYARLQAAPVSAELIARLRTLAITRGGSVCDPASTDYRPDSPVFHYRPRGGGYRPVASRRFDTLHKRWQRTLPWANDEQVGYHHLRHSMAAILKSRFGPLYAKRYLRHADGGVTELYGVCTLEELARAMAELLDFAHPLVHGVEDRRAETLRRLGIERRHRAVAGESSGTLGLGSLPGRGVAPNHCLQRGRSGQRGESVDFEQPDRHRRRLGDSREEYAQRLLTSLIVGGAYPRWNTRNPPCPHGADYLQRLWSTSFPETPWPAGTYAFVDEFDLPSRTPAEEGRAPDQAVEWADVLWLIELKTEKASHSRRQMPDSVTLARHHHPGKQLYFTYLTPPAAYAIDLPDWVTFTHVTWTQVLPIIRHVWAAPNPAQMATVDGLVDVLAHLHITKAAYIATLPDVATEPAAPLRPFDDASRDAAALAAATAEDRTARALDWAAPSLEQLEALRLQVRSWLASAPPDSPLRHVVPWKWSATTTDGSPKTDAGRHPGFELRFSYYTTPQH